MIDSDRPRTDHIHIMMSWSMESILKDKAVGTPEKFGNRMRGRCNLSVIF